MTDIERLISRYLDRELSPEEEGTFHRILSESPTARRRLREMEAIRSAARRIPSLTTPPPQVESLLFQQLFAEESSVAEEPGRRRAIPLTNRISGMVRRRSGVLSVALLLVALVAGGGIWIGDVNVGSPARIVADAASGSSATAPEHSVRSSEAAIAHSSVNASGMVSGNEQEGSAAAQRPTRSDSRGRASVTTRDMNPARRSVGDQVTEEVNGGMETNPSIPYADIDADRSVTRSISDNLSGVASWPPVALLGQDRKNHSRDHSGNTAAAAAADRKEPIVYAAEPRSGRRDEQGISASYRHGLAYLEKGDNRFTTQDFSLRFEGRFEDRHRLSLAVGQSPLVVERTTRTLPTGMVDDGKGASVASQERIEHFSDLADEVWAGIGYGYAVVASDRVRLEPGVSVGVGERSLRFGAELPVRYRLTERFSLDLVASVSRVQPHDQILRDIDREYDLRSFLHVDEEKHPVFTTVGASIGISFDIGR